MSLTSADVMIVGAGFTGTALALNLVRQLPSGSRVVLVGSPRAIGRGVAYGTTDPAHLLNVRAARMSLYQDQPDHFVRWLAGRTDAPSRDAATIAQTYVPRQVYGEYLTQTLADDAAQAQQRGRRLEVREGTVVSLERDSAGFVARLASGDRIFARVAALCTGHTSLDLPLRPDAIDLAARAHIISDPWSDHRTRAIAPDSGVLLVGTGLTMVDQVLSLARRGHHGRITAASPRGLLPRRHLAPARTEPVELEPQASRPIAETTRRLIAFARSADQGGGDWRAVVDGTRLQMQEIWRRLDEGDRRRFLRHVAPWWSVHRHRMAPTVADEIEGLRRSGTLEIRAARLSAVRQLNGRTFAVLKPRSSTTVSVEPFDYVINCSGLVRTATAPRNPVISDLFEHGLARPDPLRFGVDVTDDAVVIGRNGRETLGLFALGPPTAGRFYEITAVGEIKRQAFDVAARITALTAARHAASFRAIRTLQKLARRG